MQLDEKTHLTDKNIKIETGAGNTVNVTCSYTEGRLWKHYCYPIWSVKQLQKEQHNRGCPMIKRARVTVVTGNVAENLFFVKIIGNLW